MFIDTRLCFPQCRAIIQYGLHHPHQDSKAFPLAWVASIYPSCANSLLTRGGIGAGNFDIGVGDGGVVDADVGAEAGPGVGVGAGAGAGGTGAGAGAVTIWAQVLALIRRYPSVAQRADSRLQLPEVSKAPLDGAT